MKRNWSKIKVGLLLTLSLFLVAACSDSDNSDSESSEDKITINIAYGNQPDEPIGHLAEKWKELVEEKTDGQIEFKLYPNSQLGAEKDVVEQAEMGNNVIVLTGYDFLMDYVPDVGILTAPYIGEDFDELIHLTETEWFEGIKEELKDQNIDIINASTVYGERHLLTGKEVSTPEDLKGMKIRVPDNQMSIKTFEALGASATPSPLGELYTSLQQGLVDGSENPLSVLQGSKAHEVSKELSLTGHQQFIAGWIAGTSFMETVPEDLVEVIEETGIEAAEYGRGKLEEVDKEVLEEFEDEGVNIHEVDIGPFKDAVQEVYSDFPEWSPGLYEEVQELLENR